MRTIPKETLQPKFHEDQLLGGAETPEGLRMGLDLCVVVAHELQTPIASLKLITSLMGKRGDSLPPGVRTGFKRILVMQEQAIEEIKNIVEPLLHHSRSKGTAHAEFPTLTLATFFRSCVAGFNLSAAHGRVSLTLQVDDSYHVALPLSKIRLIVRNLVSNALKYSPKTSEVDLTVSDEGDFWRLEVSDRGRGIPVEDQARLFRPYARASNVNEVPGVGLGLFLVLEAVDTCGGTLEYRTSAGAGTTFRVRLPRFAGRSPCS
jgi:signal transduction histidine kinase